MSQQPSVGRIVHYHGDGTEYPESQPIAAIITDVNPSFSDADWYAMGQSNGDGGSDLPDQSMVVRLDIRWPDAAEPLPEWGTLAPFSDEPKPGHWSWPPRV